MLEGSVPPDRELQLELLLRELLEGEGAATPVGAVQIESGELRDIARRVRAASQWPPLPEGRFVVRRVLIMTAEQARTPEGRVRPARSWPVGGLAMAAAMTMLALVFGLQAGLLGGLGAPSSPLYGFRIALDEVGITFVPTPAGKAELLVRAAQARIAEIDAMIVAGNTRGVMRAAAALDGEAGWLRAITASLPPAERRRVEESLRR